VGWNWLSCYGYWRCNCEIGKEWYVYFKDPVGRWVLTSVLQLLNRFWIKSFVVCKWLFAVLGWIFVHMTLEVCAVSNWMWRIDVFQKDICFVMKYIVSMLWKQWMVDETRVATVLLHFRKWTVLNMDTSHILQGWSLFICWVDNSTPSFNEILGNYLGQFVFGFTVQGVWCNTSMPGGTPYCKKRLPMVWNREAHWMHSKHSPKRSVSKFMKLKKTFRISSSCGQVANMTRRYVCARCPWNASLLAY